MTSNNLTKEEQIEKGQKTAQKGDWCEYIAAAHFRKEGYLTYIKMSGPIDLILIHEETGEVRYIDVKYKNTRQGTNTRGRRINRSVNSRLGKHLKNFINIEIIYVDDEGKIEKSSPRGRQEWHNTHKLLRNKKGQYTGEILKKNMKWNKKTFLDFKFNLYAKERIKQKNNNEHIVFGSKKEAAKKVTSSNLFIDELSSMGKYFKRDHTLLLTQAVSDPRPRYRNKLLKAFQNNGENNII